jgi:DNA-binding Lrp family transcriptional regulator
MDKKSGYLSNLPQAVIDTIEKLKKEHTHYVEVKVINNKVYIFESTTKWNNETKKRKKISKYLGKITEDGEFVEGKHRIDKNNSSDKFIADDANKRKGIATNTNLYVDKTDEILLRALSMNGRVSAEKLSKITGLNKSTIFYRKRRLEKKFEIHYFAEMDLNKLGYMIFGIFVKFIDKKPGIEDIRTKLKKDKRIIFAAITNGKYDLIMYFIDNKEPYYGNIRENLDYPSTWYEFPLSITYSFIPFNHNAIEILKDKVWVRSKEKFRPSENQITSTDFEVLKELNEKGDVNFTEIDKKYGFNKGRSQYSYYKLKEKGIIKRITITMKNLPIKYNAMIFLEVIERKKVINTRDKLFKYIIRDYENLPLNRITLVGEIAAPDGASLIFPIIKEDDLENARQNFQQDIKGIKIDDLIITNIIIGSLCYRKFDNMYSLQYEILVKDYKYKEEKKINYE